MSKLAINICKMVSELSEELDSIESYMPDITTEDSIKAKLIEGQIAKLLTALSQSDL